MAETVEPAEIEVTNDDLFKAATAPEPTTTETPPPHPKDESRDVHGRFRPRQDQQQPSDPPAPPPPAPPTPIPGSPPTPGTPTQPPQQDDANVPSWRLREEREQREALGRQLQERDYALRQLQQRMAQFEQQQAPQQELPDPLIDPQGYRRALEGKFQGDLRTVQLENNLQLNRLQHGPVFDEAYQAFMQAAQGDAGFARLIVNSPNPGSAMVNWYKRAVTLARVGDDPDAYVNAEIERRFADPQFVSTLLERARAIASGQAPAPVQQYSGTPPRQNNVTQIPPSLSRIPSGSPTETAVEAVRALDDQDLFQKSLPPKRNRG